MYIVSLRFGDKYKICHFESTKGLVKTPTTSVHIGCFSTDHIAISRDLQLFFNMECDTI